MFFFVFRLIFVLFFKQKTAYELRISDWSSDVCSSDLWPQPATGPCIRRLSDRKSRQNRRVQRLLRRGWWIWRAARWHGPAHCQRLSTHPPERRDRKSVVSGKSVSVRVDIGGRRIIKKKRKKRQATMNNRSKKK